ncbi:MAG: hypothetical protein RSC80_09845, partial [Odoribacter sp.]
MRKIIYTIALFCLFLAACEKSEDFHYKQSVIDAEAVDSILLKANHDMMVATPQNALTLTLSLYTRIDKPDTTLYYHLLNSRVKEGGIRYYYRTTAGEEKEFSGNLFYGLPSVSGEITLYAKVFDRKSNEVKVNVREAKTPDHYIERDIQVIFHVVEYGGLAETDYSLVPEFMLKKLKKANIAFRKTASLAPNATDVKLNFVPATKAPNGSVLQSPGWDLLTISESTVEETIAAGKTFDFNTFITKKKLAWDYTQYLNIWIVRTSKTIPSPSPCFITETTAGLNGLKLKVVAPPYSFLPTDYGIILEYNQFVKEDLAYYLGQYLGLLPTSYPKKKIPAVDTDYCEDTFMYSSNDDRYDFKTDPKRNITYPSDNIMDKKSTSTTITYDQLKRILLILENSPVRQNWQA